ncbi:hypothetical protein GJ633_02665 [Halorubrum sp. CBA1125]|uniref:HalOD1 output domain-containing protein n=1 Tax=Halorubrum sp. CBA1125 TaxID=2668072 RepID=UPI0012E98AA2|nr:HalOD1 output domain-containing protein [Halorubrum sp. CBA1125]MUW13680.1 hypothetical protein [Halorubrum sp. CBA1125]
MNERKDPITRIVDAVANTEDVESIELEPPIAEVVDPNALETLIEDSTASELEVQFAYRVNDIVVDDSGRVQVD